MTTDQPWDRSPRRGRYWGDSAAGMILLAANTGRLLINERSGNVDGGRSYGVYGGGFWLEEDETFDDINPVEVALQELREEAGFRGSPSDIQLLFDYYDPRADWHYWTYLGVVPQEFRVRSGADHAWEGMKGSGWYTLAEVRRLQPKVVGFDPMWAAGESKVIATLQRLGFTGDEDYRSRGGRNRSKSVISRGKDELMQKIQARRQARSPEIPPEFPKPGGES